jgi:hypothetical protein
VAESISKLSLEVELDPSSLSKQAEAAGIAAQNGLSAAANRRDVKSSLTSKLNEQAEGYDGLESQKKTKPKEFSGIFGEVQKDLAGLGLSANAAAVAIGGATTAIGFLAVAAKAAAPWQFEKIGIHLNDALITIGKRLFGLVEAAASAARLFTDFLVNLLPEGDLFEGLSKAIEDIRPIILDLAVTLRPLASMIKPLAHLLVEHAHQAVFAMEIFSAAIKKIPGFDLAAFFANLAGFDDRQKRLTANYSTGLTFADPQQIWQQAVIDAFGGSIHQRSTEANEQTASHLQDIKTKLQEWAIRLFK